MYLRMLVLGCLRRPCRTTAPIVDAVAFRADPTPMWLYDCGTSAVVEVNEAAVRHYGYSRWRFCSMTLAGLDPQARRDASLTSVAVSFRGRSCRLVLASDALAGRDHQRALAYLTHREEMGRLPHRAHVVSALDDAVEASREHGHLVAVLFIDLSTVANATDLSARLRSAVRSEDFIAGLRDHELIVILRDLEKEEQLSACVGRLVRLASERLPSAHIGVTVAPADGSRSEALLRAADEAMQEAKARGVSVHYFTSGDGSS